MKKFKLSANLNYNSQKDYNVDASQTNGEMSNYAKCIFLSNKADGVKFVKAALESDTENVKIMFGEIVSNSVIWWTIPNKQCWKYRHIYIPLHGNSIQMGYSVIFDKLFEISPVLLLYSMNKLFEMHLKCINYSIEMLLSNVWIVSKVRKPDFLHNLHFSFI